MSKARFEVSTEGMKGLHDGRPLWSLVKELVANAWDEDTSLCEVTIEPFKTKAKEDQIFIKVEDDGPGFKDIDDSYTLMAPTSKRQDESVRGRFNIGEKEILSIAISGEVETVGNTVKFPKSGGRKISENKRQKGTIVSAIVQRPHEEIQETVDALLGFLPPENINYSVNGEVVRPRKKVGTVNGTLHTVNSSGIGEPLRYSYKKGDIDIFYPTSAKGHIYEMGITIQEIDAPYDIDVQLKVPMPPNRDPVTERYLQDIYSNVLRLVADDLTESEASEHWVQLAVEDKDTPDEVVKKVMFAKLGGEAVLWSNDTNAVERAHDAGMDVIQPRTLSKIERERFKKVGLQTAKDAYGLKHDETSEIKILKGKSITKAMKDVEDYAKWMSLQLLGFECKVRFIEMQGYDNRLAQYGSKTLDFVVDALGKNWFQMKDGNPTEYHTEMILHELAHEGHSKTPHTGEYVHRIAELGAKATHIALTQTWWKKQ